MKNTVGGVCRRLLSCGAIALVPVFSARAVEPEPAQVGETVVTATRTPTEREKVGSAVSVVTREQIENSQARTVAEVLRTVPGVSVVQSGRQGGQTSVFIRGVNSNQTLFLIDGARFNNPLNGLVTLANLNADEIERIEVVRGPQSTLYGADALGGVVNIITRKGSGPLTGSLTLEGGSNDGFRQAGEISGSTEKFSGALSISHLATDNEYPNDDFENLTVAGSATFRPVENLMLGATIRYTKAETGLPGPIVAAVPANLFERLEDQTLFVRLGAELTLFEIWHQTLSISETHEELYDRGDPFSRSDSRADVLQINWQHELKLSKNNTFTGGVDWYVNRGEYETLGATPFEESVENTAFYLQDQFTVFERLSLTGGVRYDDNSRFGDQFTYRGAGVLSFPETGTRLKASIGTGFKAPSLNDLFLSFPSPPPFASFVANPDLKPEKSTGWDAGFAQDLGQHATFEARYFENDVRDLITFDTDGANFTQKNVQRARTRGIEASLEVRPLTDLTLWASYTWLAEYENLTTGAKLLRRPDHTGNVGANYRFLERFNVNTSVTLVSRRQDIDPVTFATGENGAYAKWDIAVSADLSKNLRLFGRVENLLDDSYQEAKGFPALGRVFWGGITAKF